MRIRHSQLLSALAIGLLAIATFCGCALAKEPDCVSARGRSAYKIESKCMRLPYDNQVRTFRIYVPTTPAKKPLPLLLALHGGGGSGSAMEALTLGQFNRLGDKHGFVVLYPDGIERGWNDGRSDLKTKAAQDDIDDVGFLRALVTHVSDRYSINKRRVYATGISNGGLMSYRLACDSADVFAAIAPVAANLAVELANECRPARGISVAIFNGTDDPIMPWTGGDIKVLWSRRGTVLSTQATFERWLKLNDCALPSTHMPINRIADDSTSLVKHDARDCSDGSEVQLYEILGGGHTWPGGNQYLAERIVGKVSRELNASETIWKFFSRRSL